MRNCLLSIVFLIAFCPMLTAQDILILNRALELAATHSTDLKLSALSLEKTQQSLKVQETALKSDFDLSLTPFSYSNQ